MSTTVIRLPERPFPNGWEQSSTVDTCPHQWESVYAEDYPGRFVEVDRCISCRTPRCDRKQDGGQCIERRHHDGLHIFPSGRFDPVGGCLPDEEER